MLPQAGQQRISTHNDIRSRPEQLAFGSTRAIRDVSPYASESPSHTSHRNSKHELVCSGTCTNDSCWYLPRWPHTAFSSAVFGEAKDRQRDLRLRILVEVEATHRRHIRRTAARGRPARPPAAATRRDPPRARHRLWLRRRRRLCRRRRGRRGHIRYLVHLRRRLSRSRLLWVEVHADVIKPCMRKQRCRQHAVPDHR